MFRLYHIQTNVGRVSDSIELDETLGYSDISCFHVTLLFGSRSEGLVFILLLATTYTATAFLLSSRQCVAPAPCTCSSSSINCNSKSLTAVPHLGSVTTNEYTSIFYIKLNSNKIHSIPANVFQNISSVHTPSISLNFDNNMISSIDPLAFTGVENTTKYLRLSYNQLSHLPTALGKLNRLENLYLEGNPLVSIDASVTAHLSSHLTTLNFYMGHFSNSTWPAGLSKLNQLHTLNIYHIPQMYVPLNAFAGFESGLTTLILSNSKLSRIPAAVCHLQNLQALNFDNNVALESNNSIFEPCSHNLTKLTLLTLRSNNLYSFPDVLQYFRSLITLYLRYNKISSIPTNVIPYVNSLQELHMHGNVLIKIPFALNKLKHLRYLYLVSNQITTIEDHDLVGLTNLNHLELQHNPIEYIAPDAFSHNAHLQYLDLTGTKLQLIPEAVGSLARLTYLDFSSNNADCSCKMAYLKRWNVAGVRLHGTCAYQQSHDINGIKQFLLTDLTYCQ